jgi:hypothetical protein
MPNLPERHAIYDLFEGFILGDDRHQALASDAPQNTTKILHQGTFVIRYAVQYLGKPHICIVPNLLVLDRGAMLTGEECWHFLLHKSNLYPRADIMGIRNDGKEDTVFVKQLDIDIPAELLVYADQESIQPLARTRAFIGNKNTLSVRTQKYARVYPDFDTWQTDIHDVF